MKALQGARRDHRIDLFRGVALLFIFWDHVPGSILGHLTLRNVGLSDAAEIFVLLAGFAAMLAYGGQYVRRGFHVMSLRALRRVAQLYVAHVFLLAVLMAVVFVANDRVVSRDFIAETGLGWFLERPQQALIAGLLLTFKPMLMDPLPLYIVLVLMVPLIVPAVIRWPLATLGMSATVYAAAQVLDLNLPSRPEGVWFFNPLAWQLLFVIGAFLAAPRVRGDGEPAVSPRVGRALVPWAMGYLVLGALLALSWRVPHWHDAVMPRWLGEFIYPISKTDLAPMRLLHVLALVCFVWRFVPQGAWLEAPLSRALRLMGRHSLHVFCAGVLLSPVADTLNALSGEHVAVQVLTGLGGAVVMWLVARVLEEYRQLDAAPSPGPAPVAAPAEQVNAPRT